MQRYSQIRWAILPFLFLFLFLNGYGHFLLHHLMEHEDTMHIVKDDSNQDYFESEHIHCDIMDLHLQPSIISDKSCQFTDRILHTLYIILPADRLSFSSFLHFSNRAPPFQF